MATEVCKASRDYRLSEIYVCEQIWLNRLAQVGLGIRSQQSSRKKTVCDISGPGSTFVDRFLYKEDTASYVRWLLWLGSERNRRVKALESIRFGAEEFGSRGEKRIKIDESDTNWTCSWHRWRIARSNARFARFWMKLPLWIKSLQISLRPPQKTYTKNVHLKTHTCNLGVLPKLYLLTMVNLREITQLFFSSRIEFSYRYAVTKQHTDGTVLPTNLTYVVSFPCRTLATRNVPMTNHHRSCAVIALFQPSVCSFLPLYLARITVYPSKYNVVFNRLVG